MWTALLNVLLLLTLLHFWIKHRLSYWKRNGVCSVKPAYFFGNMKKAGRRHLSEISSECYRKLKGKDVIGGFYFFLRPTLLILDPNLIRHVLVKDFAYFQNRGIYYNERDDPMSANLLTIEGHRWKELRAKITPSFTTGKLRQMFDLMLQVGNELEKHVSELATNGRPIDARDICSRFNTDIIGSCAFGIDCNSFKDPNTKFRTMGRKFVDLTLPKILKFLFTNAFGDFSRALGIRFVDKQLSDFFTRTIAEVVESRERRGQQQQAKRNDLLNTLLEISRTGRASIDDEDGGGSNKQIFVGKLTFEEVCAQAFVFFIGGFEASSTTMCWCMYELAKSPSSVQDKLIGEVKSVLQRYNNRICYDAIQEMKYLEQVIAETLRLHPTIESLPRVASTDYEVPNSTHVITKGTIVLVPVYAIHHDTEYYPNPEQFNPERFTEEEIAKRVPYTYLPGGEGPRVCVGMRFAMLQIKIGLVLLLRQYKFRVNAKTKEPIKVNPKSPLVVPKSQIWIDLQKHE